MKHLLIQRKEYRELIHEFRKYVYSKGYSTGSQNMMPSILQEFLYRMEQERIHDLRWIEPQHIQKHYEYLSKRPNTQRSGGLSSSMLANHVLALRTFFRWLYHLNAIDINPMSGLDFPRPEPNPREALTIEDVQELYAHTKDHRERALLSIYYGCGLRRSEGQDLDRRDINFSRRILIVRKGKFGKRREVPITGVVLQHLKDYWTHGRMQYVRTHTEDNMKAFLLNNMGDRMQGDVALRILSKITARTSIRKEVNLHILRHSIATHLKQNGMPIEQVQQILGHSSLDVTQGYMRGYRTKRSFR